MSDLLACCYIGDPLDYDWFDGTADMLSHQTSDKPVNELKCSYPQAFKCYEFKLPRRSPVSCVLDTDGKAGIRRRRHGLVLCVLVDCQQDWSTEGEGNSQQPPGAHPPTDGGSSDRADLLHRLCVPAQQGGPGFHQVLRNVHVWKNPRPDHGCSGLGFFPAECVAPGSLQPNLTNYLKMKTFWWDRTFYTPS